MSAKLLFMKRNRHFLAQIDVKPPAPFLEPLFHATCFILRMEGMKDVEEIRETWLEPTWLSCMWDKKKIGKQEKGKNAGKFEQAGMPSDEALDVLA